MIAVAAEDPQAVLDRFWLELRADPDLAGLAALVPSDRELTIVDALPLIPAVMALLRTAPDQLRLLERASRAYLRAAGLHICEE